MAAGAGLVVMVALAEGCNTQNKPTPENFMKTMNAYFQDRKDCLFPQGHTWPYEVAPARPRRKTRSRWTR